VEQRAAVRPSWKKEWAGGQGSSERTGREGVERDAIDDIHRANTDPDMGGHRPTNGEVVDKVGHKRMSITLALTQAPTAEVFGTELGQVKLGQPVMAIAVFFLNADRTVLYTARAPTLNPLLYWFVGPGNAVPAKRTLLSF